MVQRRGRTIPAMRSALMGLGFLAAGVFGAGAYGTSPAVAAEFNPAQKAEMGDIIRDYLVQNPEVLQQAMSELERRQKAQEEAKRQQVVDTKSSDLFNGPNDVVLGNPKGKVTLVEFFDYNCGYCKRSLDDVAKLMKTEPEMRLVLKDFPVLGPGSVEAAYIAGAVRNQFKGDQFWQFHTKLLGGQHGPVGKAQALQVAKEMGANMDQITRDAASAEVKSTIQGTMGLADALGLTGTPTFVVGKEVVVGAVGYDELKDRVDSVLKCGKAVCS
ncbi:MAG: DsbA family protein [Janthinobacterium lividum]